MAEPDRLAESFEQNRTRLRAVAYRMLGSFAEADDAVQEAWLRLSRSDADGVDNLSAWLTTVVARVCLNALRARNTRREEPIGVHVPDPVISRADGTSPEDEALLADSVGLALLVVLETLTPAERLAFVLHDMFDLPFDVHAPDRDVARQREVVDAFFAAAHRGDFGGLVAVLDPDVVLRSDGGPARQEASMVLRGAAEVARRTLAIAHPAAPKHPVLVNGAAGVLVTLAGQPVALMGFTVSLGRITEIDAIADPDRLRRLDLAALLG